VRRIGPLGTWSRVVVGGVLLFFAFFHGDSWGIRWYEAVLGLAVLPLLMLVLGITIGHLSSRPLRMTGTCPTAINCAVIVALVANPYTGGAVDLFYGVTLLAAAWRGQPGCEATVISNWILGRDDQVGCPVFSPIDRAERHRQMRTSGPSTADRSSSRR
jgi:hypothetical protein